ncbi:MAG: DUF2752 domain-containing protein [Bacteroidales bacterium]|nr:DUF2752 domain-containing protein [Bacteroidales bacterium]
MILYLPYISAWQNIIKWLESHQQPCKWKKNFGIECLGCGFQSAFIALLKGNITESLKLYPALIPIICLFLFLVLHIIFKFKHGAKILMWSFILVWIIMITSYIIKLTN